MKLIQTIVSALALIVSAVTMAQTPYPSKPVRVIVPFSAGAGVDAFARALSQALGEELKQTFIVENKAGAGGIIGNAFVAQQPADGYTILATTDTSVYLTPQVVKSGSFDPMKGLVPVAIAATTPSVIVVHPSLPVHNIKELVDYSKKGADPLPYGTPGAGSLNHLAGESLALATGAKLTHIPYKGAAPALSDLLAAHVKVGIMILASAAPHIDSGKLRALAVVEDHRSKLRPDIPTVAESGVPNFGLPPTGLGIWVPAGTPEATIATLSAAIEKATARQGVKSVLESGGVEIQHVTAVEAKRAGEHLYQMYGKLVKETNISAD